MNELWNTLAGRAGVTLTEEQHAKLHRYLDLLLDANTRMNLTRITDRAQAELHHIADVFTLLPFLPAGEAASAIHLADVGSGGGVPGIPLAIVRPDIQILLIESTKKKAVFLREAIAQLELPNVTVSDERVEEVAQSERRESFQIVVARAVATIDWLCEWCLPLVAKRGKFLAMKGPKVKDELPLARRVIKFTGGAAPIIHPVDLPGTEHRVIVEIPKAIRSQRRYPRLPTEAKGKPVH